MKHNNDREILILIQIKQYLVKHNIKVLRDKKYEYYLIVPTN